MPSLENLHAGELMNTPDPNQYKEQALPSTEPPHPEWNDWLLGMARGKLSGADLTQTQAHIDQCPACQAAYEDYQEIIDLIDDEIEAHALSEFAHLEAPPGLPPQVKQVLADYAAGRPLQRVEPRLPIPPKERNAPIRPEKRRQAKEPLAAHKAPARKTTSKPASSSARPAPIPPKARINSILGAYKVLTYEGTVGPFQRYMGEPRLHPTPVEILVLSTSLPAATVERFREEAKKLQRLKHPNIVPVIGYGVKGESAYLVLGYTPAETLREKYPPGRSLAPETVESYVEQIAGALASAHRRGIIHRHIRPENLLLDSRGKVLVAHFDLSLSSLAADTEQPRGDEPTPYTAPEQVSGAAVPASDQYSLAAVAYEWLTGNPPSSGASVDEPAERLQQSKPISLRKNRTALLVAWDQVVLKALSQQPKDRYPNIATFAQALSHAIKGVAAPTVANVAETAQGYTTPEPPIPPQKDGPVVYTGHSGPVLAVAWSTHGHHIASGGVDGTIQVWDAQRGHEVARYSHHKEEITALSWGFDKDLLASASKDGDVHIWEPQSGKRADIYTSYPKPLTTVAWSPDNELLACGGEDHTVHVWRIGERQPFIVFKGHSKPLCCLVWSPDSKRIASADTGGTVLVWEIDAGTKRPITIYSEHKKSVAALAWSPNGSRIASGGEDTDIAIWQADSGAAVFSYTGHKSTVSALDWSPDGKYVASGDHEGAIHVWAAHTGEQFMTLPSVHTDRITGLAWSPAHNNFLASSSLDGTAIRWEILPQQV